MNGFWGVVWAIGPTIVLGIIFWMVMRGIIRADRSERTGYAKLEAQERARRAANRSDSV